MRSILDARFYAFVRLIRCVTLGAILGSTIADSVGAADEATARQHLATALQAPEKDQAALIQALPPHASLKAPLDALQRGGLFIFETPEGERIPIQSEEIEGEVGKFQGIRIDSNTLLVDSAGNPVQFAADDLVVLETNSRIRRAIRSIMEVLDLVDPVASVRKDAVFKLGMKQDMASVPVLQGLLDVEADPTVRTALIQAIAVTNLGSSDPVLQTEALELLRKTAAVPSRAIVEKVSTNPDVPKDVRESAARTLKAIDNHLFWTDFFGTIFRGVSLGSVLLVVALGLAITFGLMGVINMAHGEIMVVGGYATYLVQCIFATGVSLAPFGINVNIPGFGFDPSSGIYQSYFIVALPIAFLSAAAVGILLERGVIQFLYRRPLESLLATWGVSLVMQQLFRLIFGPANAPVYSPAWLLGSFQIGDVTMNYNRVFVIIFAIFIVAGTALLLAKTPIGLLIRAVMQDRTIASCMGVRTGKVNMLTFAFGSGLAGLAGAFLSQIGNIGPSTGQTYIVDAFMVVVVGGVGNLIGTVISALGIGTVDQMLQTGLRNPVIGKVLVLIGIILFLQWKPSGLFATKGRGLES